MSPRLAVLLGQAVGDALGAGTEFQTPQEISQKYGEVTGYVQGVNYDFAPGEFTDDTHMALCILGGYWDQRVRGDDLLEATLRRFQGHHQRPTRPQATRIRVGEHRQLDRLGAQLLATAACHHGRRRPHQRAVASRCVAAFLPLHHAAGQPLLP